MVRPVAQDSFDVGFDFVHGRRHQFRWRYLFQGGLDLGEVLLTVAVLEASGKVSLSLAQSHLGLHVLELLVEDELVLLGLELLL